MTPCNGDSPRCQCGLLLRAAQVGEAGYDFGGRLCPRRPNELAHDSWVPENAPAPGARVDTPFGLGVVCHTRHYEEFPGAPLVEVTLEARGMTVDDTALLSLDDVDLFND